MHWHLYEASRFKHGGVESSHKRAMREGGVFALSILMSLVDYRAGDDFP